MGSNHEQVGAQQSHWSEMAPCRPDHEKGNDKASDEKSKEQSEDQAGQAATVKPEENTSNSGDMDELDMMDIRT